jgi:hypothetical protein
MLEPHEHGMGSAAEATSLYPVEDRLNEAAANRGLVYVGRLRNDDAWQLTFYGSEEAGQMLATLTEQVDLGGRTVEVGRKGDAEWELLRRVSRPRSGAASVDSQPSTCRDPRRARR